MSTPCASWSTPFTPVANTTAGTVCVPQGSTSLTDCSTMTDGTNSLWYANKTLSATNTTQYGVGTFFSYTANLPRTNVTFDIDPFGIGFYYSDTYTPNFIYENSSLHSTLCLRNTFPFLALIRNDSIYWNETTNPPFYYTPEEKPPAPFPSTARPVSSSSNTNSNDPVSSTWPYVLVFSVSVVVYYVWRGKVAASSSDSQQPDIQVNGQRQDEEALPAYQPAHEMGSIVSTAPPPPPPLLATRSESNAGLSVQSGRISVAPSASGSAEVLLLESWSVEEVAAWVRLNGAGRAGAERVRENQMNGGVLAQLTVEEILQVFALEDDYEKDKLREALAVLKANNGEAPPVYV
ncbi:hypothetical protein BJ741DRAFT_598820 [Chytriomyces cf. hyalinus JEL632]|nr:hypothetical protein BJ741DRAFT_598820 [Chytriomyces cf. hyalinus JEL632]